MTHQRDTRVFEKIQDWRFFRAEELGGRSLGFVPTMGALHPGHASLVRRSAQENDLTLVSIFVNPTQFNDPKDLEKYPRTLEKDLEILRDAGADFLIYPDTNSMYPDGYRYKITENEFSTQLCGAHRPGHFDGVLSVVMKLLNLARADRAYFGEKDYQQLTLIRGMVDAFFHPTRIVPCPTLRERDGLAMSSRNTLLSPDERARAVAFPQALARKDLDAGGVRSLLEKQGFSVDYVEDREGRRFGAVRVGSVRLIDNLSLTSPLPQELA